MKDAFTKLKPYICSNFKIIPMYEKNMKTLELVLNLVFTIIPKNKDVDIDDFRKELKERISSDSLKKFFRKNKFLGWQFDGTRYTYEHNLKNLHPNKSNNSTLGIDLYFIRVDRKQDLQNFCYEIGESLKGSDLFKTNEMYEIKCQRK